MGRPGGVLSTVERGWRGSRECALALSGASVSVTHLIKGWLRAPERALVRPVPRVRVVPVPRWLFRPVFWVWLVAGVLTRQVRWLLCDHERTLQDASGWCRVLGVTPVLVQETSGGFALLLNGRLTSFEECFHIT